MSGDQSVDNMNDESPPSSEHQSRDKYDLVEVLEFDMSILEEDPSEVEW